MLTCWFVSRLDYGLSDEAQVNFLGPTVCKNAITDSRAGNAEQSRLLSTDISLMVV